MPPLIGGAEYWIVDCDEGSVEQYDLQEGVYKLAQKLKTRRNRDPPPKKRRSETSEKSRARRSSQSTLASLDAAQRCPHNVSMTVGDMIY